MNTRLIWLYIILGLAFYVFGGYIILIYKNVTGWEALVAIGCWTALWLLVCVPFISATTIKLHEDRKRRETFPTSEDINEEIDKILRKTKTPKKPPGFIAIFCFIAYLVWKNIRENLFCENDESIDSEID